MGGRCYGGVVDFTLMGEDNQWYMKAWQGGWMIDCSIADETGGM
jgi:hypothetical protein